MTFIDYFAQNKRFHAVVALHQKKEMLWKESYEIAPNLPKGWWELSKLDEGVKLEFTRNFWFNALPYLPHIYRFLDCFFADVKDLGVYLVQKKDKSPFEVFLSYSLKDRFFLGRPPLLQKEIETFKRKVDFPLPEDFLNFLRIHDGFFKGEGTEIFSSSVILEEKKLFQKETEKAPIEIQEGEKRLDPTLLFPFSRSVGLDIYQCFYKDWYPDKEIGNVSCSLSDKTISNWKEEAALVFPSFLDWLAFYLE